MSAIPHPAVARRLIRVRGIVQGVGFRPFVFNLAARLGVRGFVLNTSSGVTIEADIIKQKQPENNGGYNALKFGKTHPRVYNELTTDNPIDLTRWQVANCYAGRIGLINSGGESKGEGDLAQAVRTAVINKRAGGQGLIVGRKAFQRPMDEGAALIHAIQDVFLDPAVTIA